MGSHPQMALSGEQLMRLFNPATMTEVIPGFHDIKGAVELPDDNWFFTMSEVPEGKEIAVDKNGEPVLIDLIQEQQAS